MQPPPQPNDMGFLPSMFRGDVQIFTSNNLNINWQSWSKPRGASMCYILAIGGGGGGGGGFSRAPNANGGGGGGGAGGGVSRLIVPAWVLPDELYIQVGQGGVGGIAGTLSPGAGSDTVVSLGRSTAFPNKVVLASGPNSAAGNGSSIGAGGGGSAGAVDTGIYTWSVSATVGGKTGAGGGSNTGANGTGITAVWNVGEIVSAGAGGAGCGTTGPGTNFNGGGVTLQGTPDFTAQSLLGGTGGTGTNVQGNAGIQLWQPLLMCGGSGGGSNNSGVAGNGGKGGIGCGGGGGGAGNTGGKGGDGGNGMVIIVSW